ncbi:uncharacterized protein LOC105384064 [Plutella xylostella]|uniref:uncharacterized protein LOC105384064 n=1 Tax=Plutella xylostella TaxID=51655 RepID=UPI0020323550|nr:uncharacterized protein LOC105384064 [Plutella xylostella]
MSVAKLGELVKKRGSYKAKMTQFMTFLKLMPDSGHSLTPSQVLELEMRVSRLEVLYSEFDALQTELELLSEDVDERYSEREQFETQYYAQLSRARELLAAAPAPAAPAPSLDGARSSGSGCKHDFVRLPKIDLPHFDGDYQHWLQFRDTYISLIHNNSSISNINKFHYLRAALKGSASIIVQSLDLTEANYDIAWQLLSERYDNTRLLVNNHVQALFNVEPIQRESSQALRNVIDVTNKNLRALSSLGEPVDNWDTLIIFIMTKKLDPSTNRQWEEFKNSINSSPSLKQFTSFLSNRADLIETLNDNSKFINKNKSSSSSSATTISSHQDSNKQIKNFHSTTKHKPFQHKNKCPMCSDAHFLFTCESFRKLDIEARIKKASESNVCMNCLRPGHSAKSCTLSHCKYCKYRHNTLLHREIFQENDNGDNVALSTNIISSPTSACNRGIVLLSTAMARVADVDGNLQSARLLLDNGSTSNFITQDLCGKLGLVRRSTSSTVSVRAVHLELVSDLTKEGFLAAFSRFTARRGKSQRVYCDNGTNFVGAFNELTRLLESSSKDIEADIANHGIDFKFIPAYSPHFGGLWESAVKSTKHLLRRVLNLTHLTYEELSTCLIQIEAILNSRPLTPLSSDPSDLSYLSPAHFLIGRPLTSVPGPQVADVNLQQLERHERIEKLRHHFWQRYANEYVSLLQQRTKWQTDGQDLKTGTMVLIKDVNQPPLLWLLGRVTDVKPGPDGRSRVAEILTKKGTITRAYNNICPLPVSTS